MTASGKDKNNLADLSAGTSNLLVEEAPETRREKGVQQDRASCLSGYSSCWAHLIRTLHAPILKALQTVTSCAVRRPKITILASLLFSSGVLLIGFTSGFHLEVDERVLWTPVGSKTYKHREWIEHASGFPKEPRVFGIAFHADGGNVLGMEPVSRVFQALDAVRSLPDYDKVCRQSNYFDQDTGERTCEIEGVTRFWNHSSTIFAKEIFSDEAAISAMSAPEFPDGTPVPEDYVFGYPERGTDGILTFAQMYLEQILLPDEEGTVNFEAEALHVLVDKLREEWKTEAGNKVRIEVLAIRSFPDEFARAIEDDLPLLPLVFILMLVFTCSVFCKRNAVGSQTLLGLAGVVSVLLAIMTGYGLMFVCGVPFSSMTPLLPFIMFGIGLDDTFIIFYCFQRTEPSKMLLERMHDTIEDCGVSVTLTTLTSMTAFALGCLSSIPAIRWLCLYAFPTVMLILIFQLIFFVSCIALDEGRKQRNRRDCCIWLTPSNSSTVDGPSAQEEACREHSAAHKTVSERMMACYAEMLVQSYVKYVVIASFVALAIACGFSASNLKQKFSHKDVLPDDSYATDFFDNVEAFSSLTGSLPHVYFRFVDQSDSAIQRQMNDYVSDLVAIKSISSPPQFFWLRDFQDFVGNSSADLDFSDQLDLFLKNSTYAELYDRDIDRDDDSGAIISSRCTMSIDNINWEDVRSQVNALEDQRKVTAAQAINQDKDQWSFFTYHFTYDGWEFYSVMVDSLLDTTKIGISVVTVLALLFIPHWTAALFVLPMIIVLYVDLLGALQWAGIHINPVTYIAIVLSIGLMVDYLMHLLLRYYESKGNRREKTTQALQTIGISIFYGGMSTLLGTLPLAFSTSEIFLTLFFSFLFLVIIGCAHGLVLLPVVLSMFGPEDMPRSSIHSV